MEQTIDTYTRETETWVEGVSEGFDNGIESVLFLIRNAIERRACEEQLTDVDDEAQQRRLARVEHCLRHQAALFQESADTVGRAKKQCHTS